MWWLFVFTCVVSVGSSTTCNDLHGLYQSNCQACNPLNEPVALCGTGTEWSSTRQQCVIAAMTIQPYGRRNERIPIHLGVSKNDSAWHTCTCKDGSEYQCQSNQNDGAACCDRSMHAVCGEGNVDLDNYEFNTGAWHTCTCEDGSEYQCQSNQGDGAACCDRSMSAICGAGNVGTSSLWHTCTCEDGTTYECKSNGNDGAACCDRSMPAICPSSQLDVSLHSPLDAFDAVFDVDQALVSQRKGSTWHTCTCKDRSTYECQSNRGDGSACCTRSMLAICGEDNVQSTVTITEPPLVNIGRLGSAWHTCTCLDNSTYQCKSKYGDGNACCTRSMPAICGENNVPN